MPLPIKYLFTLALFLITTLGSELYSQSFAEPIMNPFGLAAVNESAFPTFVDLDGDGDMDLLVGDKKISTGLGKFNYFENIGTASQPHYTDPLTNPFELMPEALELLWPSFVDLDGDEDMDLSTIVLGDNFVLIRKYYENIGDTNNPEFAMPINHPYGLDMGNPPYPANVPVYTDIDGDGDTDVFVDYGYDIDLDYYENIGSVSEPIFANPVAGLFGVDSDDIILTNSIDLDMDGDLDFIGIDDNKDLSYFENIGSKTNPQFLAPVFNLINLGGVKESIKPTFTDLDNDGDMDLLVGEDFGNMQYFENTEIVNTNDQFSDIKLELHPNPVSNMLKIETDSHIEKIEIYDISGQLINTYDSGISSFDVGEWENGIYLIKVLDGEGKFISKSIVKK